MNCPHGGLPTLRHNELCDLNANLMSEVCHDVTTEPELQPLTGENMRYHSAITTDGARLDMRAQGFWAVATLKIFSMSRYCQIIFRNHVHSNGADENVRDIEHGTMTP